MAKRPTKPKTAKPDPPPEAYKKPTQAVADDLCGNLHAAETRLKSAGLGHPTEVRLIREHALGNGTQPAGTVLATVYLAEGVTLGELQVAVANPQLVTWKDG